MLMVLALGAMVSSCKTFTGSSRTMDIPLATKDYEVIGFVRVEGKVAKKETSYDALLSEARKKYNDDTVDILNPKRDNYKASQKVIINALVVKYTDAVGPMGRPEGGK